MQHLRHPGRIPDRELLQRFLDGRDEAAFAELVGRHGPMVLALCRRVLRDRHDAEEAFQATFLTLARKGRHVRSRLACWLFTVARRTAVAASRLAARRARTEQTAAELPEPSAPAPDFGPDWIDALHREIDRLPARQREAVVLCHLQGRSRAAAAREIGVPEGTLSSRLATALAALRGRLRPYLPAAALATLGGTAAAKVSSTLTLTTARLAALCEAALPGGVLTLSEGVTRAMFLTKLRVGLAAAAVALCLAGTGLLVTADDVSAQPAPTPIPGTGRILNDEEFLTRASLTYRGTKPTLLELRYFLADARRDKRVRVIKVMQRDHYRKPHSSYEVLVKYPPPPDLMGGNAGSPSRADRLKAILADFEKERAAFSAGIRAGKFKPNADGSYPDWEPLRSRYAKRLRALITADPTDAVALEAIQKTLGQLSTGRPDEALYKLVLEHHLESQKLEDFVPNRAAPIAFLRAVAEKSPHARVRLWARYHRAEQLHRAGKPDEAAELLQALKKEDKAREFSGYTMGTLADTADRLLFSIRRLAVGEVIPEIDGRDIAGKPMKLSDYRGKATLLVFWAAWCKPCLDMAAHERALLKQYAGRPFAVVGVNGDAIPDGDLRMIDADGKTIDHTAQVKAAMKKYGITWRSFRSSQIGLALRWGVRAWPTVILIDHKGVIRGRWQGDPGKKVLDPAVERLVKAAEAEK